MATGGGVVTRTANWGHMHHGIVVWLRGAPQLLAARVVAEDARSRPLVAHTEASTAAPADDDPLSMLVSMPLSRQAAVARRTAARCPAGSATSMAHTVHIWTMAPHVVHVLHCIAR